MSNAPAARETQAPSAKKLCEHAVGRKALVRPWRIVRPSIELSPSQVALRQRRVRIERAVMLIARTGCYTRAACRSVGLAGDTDERDVKRVCDARGIPRRHWWGIPFRNWKTQEPHPAFVKPRVP